VVKPNRAFSDVYFKIRKLRQAIFSAVDEKKFFSYQNTREEYALTLLKTGLSSDIIAEWPNRTQKGHQFQNQKARITAPLTSW